MATALTIHDRFALRLYDQLARTETGKNLLLSPFSIEVALAMCAVGARGDTRTALTEMLDAPAQVEEQNRYYAQLLRTVNGEGERPFQLSTANALWCQQGSPFDPQFQKDVVTYYDGVFTTVDFRTQPAQAVRIINDWVSARTQEKIKDLITRDLIDEQTRLILTNAIYFKGQWQEKFEQARTCPETWHNPEDVGQVPMMHQEGEYPYFQGEGFQALDLPYRGDQLSMLIVLPAARQGLAALETRWAKGGLYQKVVQGLEPEEMVRVALPRFKMETSFKLKPTLIALGAEVAFSERADFTGISPERLLISEVVHKAFVEVNEEGTEAAAATAVIMTRCSAVRIPPRPKVFTADHPFLFFIRDRNTNTILFSGRVLDPRGTGKE
jgi:serpin B